jgi:uncharacterized protein (TIRG00374 family)
VTLRRLGSLLRPLVAILLTLLVLRKADLSAVLEASARADLRWIVATLPLVVADRALMAYRWVMLLCPIPPPDRPPLSEVMRIFFVSTFAGTFLPASVGGDAVRAYGLARFRVAPAVAVASVIVDRLLGVVSIVLVAVLGIAVAGANDLLSDAAVGVSLLAASLASGAGAAIVFSERASRFVKGLGQVFPLDALRRIAGSLADATLAYGRFHRELANVLVGSVAVQLLRVAQAYCLGLALGLQATPATYLALIPIILLVMLLPVTVNGIGTSQVAFVWFFGRAGVPEAPAFALSVMFVALGVVGNLPGGILYACGPGFRSAQGNARP